MAHTAAGNRAEALHAYHELRQFLAEELGIDPAPEVQNLYIHLLQASDQDSSDRFGGHGTLTKGSQGLLEPFIKAL